MCVDTGSHYLNVEKNALLRKISSHKVVRDGGLNATSKLCYKTSQLYLNRIHKTLEKVLKIITKLNENGLLRVNV